MDGTRQFSDGDAHGLQRAAELLRQVSPEAAESVMQRLDDDQAAAIRSRMRTDDAVTHLSADRTFAFLSTVPQSVLLLAIMRERPQTIAILLSVMPPLVAPRLVRALNEARRADVIARLSRLQSVPRMVVDEVVVGLQQRIEKICTRDPTATDGVQRVASVLKQCDRDTESSILFSLAQHDRTLTEEIQQMLFRFDDIASMSDVEIQTLAKNVHAETWAAALKRAEPKVRERVFGSLSTRAIQHVRAEMDYLGQVAPSEIDQAQQQIVNIARRLQEPQSQRRAA